MAGDHLGAATVIGADDLAHVLWVEARGQRRRADEVAEHKGELTALGVIGAQRASGGSLRSGHITQGGAAIAAVFMANGVGAAAAAAGSDERRAAIAAEPPVIRICAAAGRAIHNRDPLNPGISSNRDPGDDMRSASITSHRENDPVNYPEHRAR